MTPRQMIISVGKSGFKVEHYMVEGEWYFSHALDLIVWLDTGDGLKFLKRESDE